MSKMIVRIIVTSLVVLAAIAAAVSLFMHGRQFGRLPRGERLARIERSPNYRNGAFHNRDTTVMFTSRRGFASNMLRFLFGSKGSSAAAGECAGCPYGPVGAGPG